MPAVPALRYAHVRWADDRRDAALRPGARGARHCRTCSWAARASTSARRSRRCAPRSPRSSGRTTSCRSSGRSAARCSRSATTSCWPTTPAPGPSTRFGYSRSSARLPARLPETRRETLPMMVSRVADSAILVACRASRRRCAKWPRRSGCCGSAPAPQPASGGGDDRGAARCVAGPRDLRAASIGRAGARQRSARRRAGASIRGWRRAVVPRLRRAAARRGRGDAGRRSADPRKRGATASG